MASAINCISKLNKVISNGLKSPIQRSISNLFNWEPQEKKTHTGQKWESDDYRLCRFMNKEKHVNPNWAVKLISEVPPIPSKSRVVCCDGGSGPTGHPKIFINLKVTWIVHSPKIIKHLEKFEKISVDVQPAWLAECPG